MALLQISEPGGAPDPHQRRIAVGIDLGTTHSLVAAVRHGVAECLPDDARPRDPAVGGALPAAGRAARSARRRWPRPRIDPRNTIVSVKRFMGRGLADIAGRDEAALRLRRRAGHGAAAHGRRREVAGRGVGRDPRHAAPARRRQLRRRPVRRRDHRAGLLRRRAAPGHQGRRAARRPERAAPDQRADRRGDRLRPGAWLRRALRRLRPGRRHLRHLAAAPDGRRVRGGRHRRRLGARRRRLRRRCWPTGRCAQAGLAADHAAGQARRAGGRARREGEALARRPRHAGLPAGRRRARRCA